MWRRDAATPSGALSVRLSRLDILEAADDGHATDAMARNIEEQPCQDLVADKFVLRGKDLGKLEVEAHTSHAGNGRCWTLDNLTIEQPGAALTGNGTWRVPRRLRDAVASGAASPTEGSPHAAELPKKLDIRDAGDVLDRMGMATRYAASRERVRRPRCVARLAAVDRLSVAVRPALARGWRTAGSSAWSRAARACWAC